MKNITFAADEALITAAREQAVSEGSTLNEQFRLWLARYAAKRRAEQAMAVVERLSGKVNFGGQKFTRAELNERR